MKTAHHFHLKGVVRVAAGDVARVVGEGEGVVKEIHGAGGCAVSWTSLFLTKRKHVAIHVFKEG